MKNKLEVITKVLEQPCYKCSSTGKVINSKGKDIKCDVCGGDGTYRENYYYHIANGICFASEFIK